MNPPTTATTTVRTHVPDAMTHNATRFLYLARHGQALPDESGLTDAGRRQATLLGERLRDVPLSAVHHGPLGAGDEGGDGLVVVAVQ